jgi:glycosyltransferase involved in cell wall biosynthesis
MKEEHPLVSIVTPSLNQGSFIEATILSVKNQTYPRVEHIVIDGCSTDGTLDILRKYHDTIIWTSEPDRGQSDAINKGWKMAKGEILAYLNSDDTYEPWAVETAVKFFAEHPDIMMVYGDCVFINEHSAVIRQYRAGEFDLKKMLYHENNVPQPTVFFKRAVLKEVGYLDTNLHMAMDFDFWIRISLKLKIGYIHRLLANFRMYPGTKTVSKGYMTGSEHLYILDKTFANPELPKEVRAVKRLAYSYAHLSAGIGNYSQRQMKQAQKHLIKSVILYPPQLRKPMVIIRLVTSFLGVRATEIASSWKVRLGYKPL